MVEGLSDVDVSVHEVGGAGRGAVGGEDGVNGPWRDLQPQLSDHQHGHVVGTEVGGVVQLHPGAVCVVVGLFRVVPVILWPTQPVHKLTERVSIRVVVVRELFSLVASAICVRIRGHRPEVRRVVYHMAHVFVYCCVFTTVDSYGPFPLYFVI